MAESQGLLNNLFWKFAERSAAQLVSLVVSIVLARLLMPSDYGAIAMVMVFITFAQVLVDGGFSGALIQKKNADKLDFSTVLYFVIIVSIILYVVIWFAAPWISSFYGKGYEILTPVFRVIGVQIIIYGINSVQQAYISRQMMFRKFFYSTLVGTIISAIVGLLMAYSDLGVWALVGQQLTASFVNTLTLFLITRKLPGIEFSWERLKGLLNYGIKLFGANVLISFYQEFRALIIGKLYSPADLAFFDKGKVFPNMLVMNINSSIGAVLFPKISQQQDDLTKVKQTTRNSIRYSSYVLSPLMFGLAAVSEPFIRLLLTEKWLPCVPLLQVFCITYLFMPIHTANMQAIKAIGKSGIILKLEIIKKSIELITLLLVMRQGIMAIAINMAALNFMFIFVNAYPNVKYLGYSFKEQISDVFPNFFMASLMALIVYFVTKLPFKDMVVLIMGIIVGGMVYISLSMLTKNREFIFTCDQVRERFNNHYK